MKVWILELIGCLVQINVLQQSDLIITKQFKEKSVRVRGSMSMITIFTPIYNRAYIMDRLYQSLLHQTSFDFEWLIVDDGSTDNVAELVGRWIKNTKKFIIRFYRQQNGGKHRAINYGVKMASYDAFFIVDSDDYIEDNAVELILKYWHDIENNDSVAGISGLKRYSSGEIIGDNPRFIEYIDITNFEREEWGLNGDKAEVYKTDILRRFPFPEYVDETFITEAVVWDKIAYEGYKIRWVNEAFTICEYRSDGLTAKGEQLFIDNPNGWAHYIRQERKYRDVDEKQYFEKCCRYYECEFAKLENDEMRRMLGLCEEEYQFIVDQYNTFFHTLYKLCTGKKVCIYAYGRWGKRLKEYLDHLEIQVAYVIDRQYESIEGVEAYSMDMDLPQTDVIFIALKDGAEEIAEVIKRKMPEAEIVLFGDIKPY